MSKKKKNKKAMGAQLNLFVSASMEDFDSEKELKDHLIDRLAHLFMGLYESDKRHKQIKWFEFDGTEDDYHKKIIESLRNIADGQEQRRREAKEKTSKDRKET